MNILIIAPHADDEVLGCGGIIAKYIKLGYLVNVLIVTKGLRPESTVRMEAEKSHRILGVTKTYYLDFLTTHLDTIRTAEIAKEIAIILKRLKTERLFIPFRGDIHNDHKQVFDAALVASRPINGCLVKEILAYETLSETEWGAPFASDTFIPNIFIQIEGQINQKVAAMKCYKSQIKKFPHPRSVEGIRALAKYRGVTIEKKYAEAFMLIRKIE